MSDPKVDKAFKELSDKFPARYKVKATTYLRALLYAIAEGDGYIDGQVDAVSDNSLVVTASGKYLDRLGSLYGASRGRATGVQDDDFRKIIPVIGSNPKQIITTLQKVIDYIYGPYASHANTSCSAPAPYDISNGSRLKVRCDDQEIDIYFKSSDAVNISQATAQEVATAISERSQGRIIGSVVTNVRTGEQFVNIRTSTIGSQGFIQVLGGDAQSALRFPEIRPTRREIATWNVKRYLGTDEMEYEFVSGISPAMRTAGVRIGDYLTIGQESGFNERNYGTFKVSFVTEDSFRVVNPNGVAENSITQQDVEDFTFYRPDLGNILLSARPATIIHTAQRELTVILPVTSPIVKRTLRGSHHFHCGISNVVAATETTATLASPSGFQGSTSAILVGSRLMAEGAVSSVLGSHVTMINAEEWPSSGAFFCPTERQYYFYKSKIGNQLRNITPTPPASMAGTVIKFVKKYSYTTDGTNVLTNVTPDPRDAIGFELVSTSALVEGFPGSFLYDLNAPFSTSVDETFIDEKIQQGSSRTVVGVDNVENWDKEGHFIINFGTKEQEGPIRYLNKVGQEALIIDPSHVFERDHLRGISIRRVRNLGPAIPRINGQDYPVFITGTSQARTLLAGYLRDLVAAGVVLKFKILIPEQKWPVLPLLYSSNPLEDDLAIVQPEDAVQSDAIPPSAPPAPSVPLVFDPIVVPAPPFIAPDPEDPNSSSNPLFVAPSIIAVGGELEINLSWPAIPSAISYRLLKSPAAGGPYTEVGLVLGTSYSDTVVGNTTHYYVIQAFDGNTYTAYSNEVFATATFRQIATPPTPVLSIATLSNNRTQLNWTQDSYSPYSDNGFISPSLFYIYRKTGNEPYAYKSAVAGTQTSFDDNGNSGPVDTSGVVYQYRVYAYYQNAILEGYGSIESPWSNEVNTNTISETWTMSAARTNPVNSNNFTVVWSNVVGATSYDVYLQHAGGISSHTNVASYFILPNPTAGIPYTYVITVVARNSVSGAAVQKTVNIVVISQ